MKRLILFLILLVSIAYGQGFNHQWLLGNNPFAGFPNGRAFFDSSSSTFISEFRPMSFKGSEANICDADGNFLMSTNGIWIANANNDTMMNGNNLNPSIFTNNWPYGLPIGYANIFLPLPGDSTKYGLFHSVPWGTAGIAIKGFYQSIIDIVLDNGLGAVILKNDTIMSDTLSWGVSACKHANGRDWWIITMTDGNPEIYTFLLSPTGIDTVFLQNLGFIANTYANVSPLIFSQDGKKMICSTPVNQTTSGHVLISDFDRCSGIFSNIQSIAISPSSYLYGLAFSPSGKYAYASSSNYLYQIDTDNWNIDTVANYDGFISPGPTCCATTFFNMYLAANGKIYITSGSSVQHIHEMNYPDSAGIICDVQQHSIDLVDYLHLRAVPNHPNYYLGCDTTSGCPCLISGIEEVTNHDFKFLISPNPSNGNFKIIYLLPQNKSGEFEVFDINGRKVYSQHLPQWSTMQYISLPKFSNGIYNCVITSEFERISKKLVILKQ